MIVTLDGPAGSGKSTLSCALAGRLGFSFLNTGATYRAVTRAILDSNISISDIPAIIKLMNGLDISFSGQSILVNGQDWSLAVRQPDVDRLVSAVSAIPQVRDRMAGLQRRIGITGNYVCEGRDMGSVVFPDAAVKFYIDAAPEERAARRFAENKAREINGGSYEDLLLDIRRRDALDMAREHSPLSVPDGAVIIDTTGRSIDSLVDEMAGIITARTGGTD